jgi:hypothetical protein
MGHERKRKLTSRSLGADGHEWAEAMNSRAELAGIEASWTRTVTWSGPGLIWGMPHGASKSDMMMIDSDADDNTMPLEVQLLYGVDEPAEVGAGQDARVHACRACAVLACSLSPCAHAV